MGKMLVSIVRYLPLVVVLVCADLSPSTALAATGQRDGAWAREVGSADSGASPDASKENSLAPVRDPHGLAWRYIDASQRAAYDRILACVESGANFASIPDVSKDVISAAYGAVKADHPEHWELDGYRLLENGDEGYDVWVDVVCDGRASVDAKMADVAREFVKSLPPDASDYERVKAAYEWVILHTAYDLEAPHGQSARGPLVDGKSVCAGYSAAFAYLCRESGVYCTVVTGEVKDAGLHAWNLAEIGDTLTFVDVTWGDASYVDEEGRRTDLGVSYDYLCLTTEEMLRDRTLSDMANLPNCASRAYDYYALHDAMLDEFSADATIGIIRSARDAGMRSAGVKLKSRSEYDRAYAAMSAGGLNISGLVGGDALLWPHEKLYTIGVTW